MFPNQLTLEEAVQTGFNLSRVLDRKQHRPASLTVQLDIVADHIVTLHSAGNDRATTLSLLDSSATAEATQTAIEALTA